MKRKRKLSLPLSPSASTGAATSRRSLTAEEKRALRLRRNRSRALTLTILVALTLLLSFVVIRLFLQRSHEKSGLRFITTGTLYQAIDTRALFIRSETVYTTEKEGTVFPVVAEAQQLGYGQKLALLSTEDVTAKQNQLKDLQEQLASRQMELLSQGQGEGAEEAFSQAEQAFRSSAATIAEAAVLGDLRPVEQENIRIQNSLNQRNNKLSRLSFHDPLLATLQERIQKVDHELEQVSSVIYSKNAGLVSYSSDGLEEDLQFDKVNQLTVEKITRAFESKQMMESTLGLRKEGQSVARVVEGLYQYAVFDVPEASLPRFEQESTVSVYFPNQAVTVQNCPVMYRLRHAKGMYLFVRMDKQLDKFLRERKAPGQLRTYAESGLIVPTSSLVFAEGQEDTAQLVTVQSGFARFVPVRVKIRNADQSLIESLDPENTLASGNLVVENPKSIKDGDRLDQ